MDDPASDPTGHNANPSTRRTVDTHDESRSIDFDYLWRQILLHVRVHFSPAAAGIVERTRVRSGPMATLAGATDVDLLIPTDRPRMPPERSWRVPFRETSLTLWASVPAPDGWTTWPSPKTPLWHVRADGALLPAWDLFGNLLALLTLEEERAHTGRDAHGRVTGAMSARDRAGLLEVPAFNEAVAAIVAAGFAREHGDPALRARGTHGALAAAVILSHDLDILRGNDPITQGVRLYRWLSPLARGRAPKPGGFSALVTNARAPYRHYRDAIDTMIGAERAACARSSFYFLNGTGGRHGARSGDADIAPARRRVPPGWNIGIHYNYDTLLDGGRLRAQRESLERLLGEPVAGGRAHYLRFDPDRSYGFLDAQGIEYDESLGYPDRAGYRAGIAGAYHPPDPQTGRALNLVEIPLSLMDVALYRQYPHAIHDTVLRLFRHLNQVGGTLSLLVHLEAVGRPELDADDFDYAGLLAALRGEGARFVLPGDFR
jgi:hypothetical protein